MAMRGNLLNGERNLFRATSLSESESIPEVKRNPSAKIRKCKRGLAIAAVGGPDQVANRFVLRDGEQLPFAEHPSRGRKVPREYPDFSDVRLGHKRFLSSGSEKFPGARYRNRGPRTAACSNVADCHQYWRL